MASDPKPRRHVVIPASTAGPAEPGTLQKLKDEARARGEVLQSVQRNQRTIGCPKEDIAASQSLSRSGSGTFAHEPRH